MVPAEMRSLDPTPLYFVAGFALLVLVAVLVMAH
jgi:hypothetical protein